MGLPRRQLLLPGLAVFGLVVVGFLSLARRDGMPRPTQLRAHQQQQTLSVEVLESASFETGMDALGEGGMDEIDESPGEQTGVEQAGVVGDLNRYALGSEEPERSKQRQLARRNVNDRTSRLRKRSCGQGRCEGEGPLNIKYVALIAERHSGSTWMVQFLQGYFKGKDIQVTATLCTWKHWFQDRIHEDLQDGKRSCRAMQKCPACLDIGHTLVIAMWRNPYDWMSGMNRLPHHAKAHVDMDLPSFMQKRWMLDAKPEQKARVDALMKVKNETPCLDSFLPWEVVPCRENDRSAIYELDENGEAYDNLYELRKAKIRDFNAVEAWAPYYEKILYEDMLTGTGLKDWLTSLEKTYGLYGKSGEVPSASLSKEMASSRAGMYYLNSKKCAPRCTMGGEDGTTAVKILHGMWDEKLESGLGYHQVGAPQKRM